jgi:hypothetical protein
VYAIAERLRGADRPEGLLHVTLGRQQDGETDAFILVTEWRDMDALYRWIGPASLLSATPSLGALVEVAHDVDVQHYLGPPPAEATDRAVHRAEDAPALAS